MNFRHKAFHLYRMLSNVATLLKFKVRATQNKAALNNPLIIWSWTRPNSFSGFHIWPKQMVAEPFLFHISYHWCLLVCHLYSLNYLLVKDSEKERLDRTKSFILPSSKFSGYKSSSDFVTNNNLQCSSFWAFFKRIGCWDGSSKLHCGCILHNGVWLGTLLFLQLVSRPLALVVLSNRINRLFVWQCYIHWYTHACWRMR